MSQHDKLDPYTANAENNDVTPQQKISDLHTILKAAQTGMLTSRAADGSLHSRAMTPSTPFTDSQVNLVFIANNASYKFDELANDPHVNVSFFDRASTNWASFAGTAKVITDKNVIKQYWSRTVSAFFGDLGDGVHKGDVNDPRVSAIEVIPDEVHYWLTTSGKVSRGAQIAYGAATGKTSAPGELRTINKSEIALTQGLQSKA